MSNIYIAEIKTSHVLTEPSGLAGRVTRNRLREATAKTQATPPDSPLTPVSNMGSDAQGESGSHANSPMPLDVASAVEGEPDAEKEAVPLVATGDEGGAETSPQSPQNGARPSTSRRGSIDADGFRTPTRVAPRSRRSSTTRSRTLGSEDTFYSVLDVEDVEDSIDETSENTGKLSDKFDWASDEDSSPYGPLPTAWYMHESTRDPKTVADNGLLDLQEIAMAQMTKSERKMYRRNLRTQQRAMELASTETESRDGPPELDPMSMTAIALQLNAVAMTTGDGDHDSPSPRRVERKDNATQPGKAGIPDQNMAVTDII